ncbi:pseudaminic acid cytidylyltransferase [Akkermansiaceae bacterium]|nr:pseudaminic acid cytidylyltransferase [Akkermansiaceae bacterium]
MNIAVIPARGGSKRIPRKNLKEFCGKPMISYAIELAKATSIFDRVIVSTDNNDIASLAESLGAEVPFIRSPELADDFTGTLPVIQDAIKQLDGNENPIELVSCIYPTVPLLTREILESAAEMFLSKPSGFLISASEFPAPVKRGFYFSSEKGLEMLYPESYTSRSQDLEPVYHDAGQFYFGLKKTWLESRKIYTYESRPLILSPQYVCDIDTPADWDWAQLMFQCLQRNQ